MKRPVTLVLAASLLVSASAFAAGPTGKEFNERVAAKVEHSVKRDNDRGHDNRGNSHRGNDNRGHDNRGNGHGRNDDRGNHSPPPRHGGGHDRRDDRNDHRNDRRDDHRYGNDRRDHRNDYNDRNRHDSRNNNWNGNRGWDRHRNDWNNHPNYWDNRRHDRRDYARYRYNYGHYRAPHGYHYRVWHRGDHLPRSYYGSSYIVYDWRPYRLYSPPYGYHWVRVGNDVLLTALATGVVLDVLYNIWY
jgi:Ni/Co efflux regulator RcnB